MPILPPEPDRYPDDLFAESMLSDSEQAEWLVLHTKPRAEKSLARKALNHKIPYFLPARTRTWQNRGRWYQATLPLFPGYLFVHTGPNGKLKLLSTCQVANVLSVRDQDQLYHDLRGIQYLVSSHVEMTPVERLPVGSRARITTGPLEGYEGIVIREVNGARLILKVEFIQQGVAIELDNSMIRRIEPASAVGVQ